MPQDKSSFIAIGRPDDPRWLAPAGRPLYQESFLGWQPYRMTSRMAWAAIKSAVGWGAAPAPLPADSLYVNCLANLDWRQLGWCHKSDPEPLVYIGTPGPRRKAVVHLIDPISHACELIVKVPLADSAKQSIRHEAHTLLQLEHERFSAAPRLVAFDEAAGIASQTVVTGSRAGLRCSREVAVLLQSLERRSEYLSFRQVISPLQYKVRLAATAEDAAVLARALDVIDDDSQLPAVRIHGDFAPWNIKLQNGAATLVDWEDARPRGLPLHDAYHFVHMARCLFGNRPRPMWQQMRFRYPFELTGPQFRKLELAYLVQTLLRDFPQPEQTYATFLFTTLRKALAEE